MEEKTYFSITLEPTELLSQNNKKKVFVSYTQLYNVNNQSLYQDLCYNLIVNLFN